MTTNILTLEETASYLKTSVSKIRYLVKTDKSFPCVSFGKKSNRIVAEGLEKWVLKQTKGINA